MHLKNLHKAAQVQSRFVQPLGGESRTDPAQQLLFYISLETPSRLVALSFFSCLQSPFFGCLQVSFISSYMPNLIEFLRGKLYSRKE
jgi:hypothetical protein